MVRVLADTVADARPFCESSTIQIMSPGRNDMPVELFDDKLEYFPLPNLGLSPKNTWTVEEQVLRSVTETELGAEEPLEPDEPLLDELDDAAIASRSRSRSSASRWAWASASH